MTEPVRTRSEPSYSAAEPEDLICEEPPAAEPSVVTGADLSSSAEVNDITIAPNAPGGIRGPHAEAHAEPDDLYAAAFAVKGRDAQSGLEVEVFSATLHDGQIQGDTQVAMARLGFSSDNGHFNVRGEVFTANAHIGTQNSDGSVGYNAGLGASIVGIEGTATLGPVSATVGVSASATLAGSVGVRDGDNDGKPELCARAEFGLWTVGACIERFW